jgi:hypothetical protein
MLFKAFDADADKEDVRVLQALLFADVLPKVSDEAIEETDDNVPNLLPLLLPLAPLPRPRPLLLIRVEAEEVIEDTDKAGEGCDADVAIPAMPPGSIPGSEIGSLGGVSRPERMSR